MISLGRCVLYPLELKFRSWERYEGPHRAFVNTLEHQDTQHQVMV